MSKAAFTIKSFAVYLMVLGTLLVLVPNFMLGLFGFEPTSEVWIRVLGVVVFNLGWYYWYAAISEARTFFAASVITRVFALVAFVGLVATGFAQPTLILFGAIDAAGGLWTWLALRSEPRLAT
jgi:hypothetical protein